MADMTGKTIAFLVAPEGAEQIELTHPREAMDRAGATTHLLSTEPGEVRAMEHLDWADSFPVDRVVGEVDVSDYDGLVLPGGVANPDRLRMDDAAVTLVRGFFEAGLPVAAICHAPWLLIEAGVAEGRTLTSYPSLRTDLTNAGATWRDEEVVVCDEGPNHLVTSRRPDDLEAFTKHAIDRMTA